MARGYRIPLELEPQPEGGYTVTSPDIPELITEGDTVEEALDNARDAFVAVFEIYEEQGRGIPARLAQDLQGERIVTEQLVAMA